MTSPTRPSRPALMATSTELALRAAYGAASLSRLPTCPGSGPMTRILMFR